MNHRHSKLFILLNKTSSEKKTVKISKEPPAVVYFERDALEDTFVECIFDPQVLHDEEKDYPELFIKHNSYTSKPWQRSPHVATQPSIFLKLKSIFHHSRHDHYLTIAH